MPGQVVRNRWYVARSRYASEVAADHIAEIKMMVFSLLSSLNVEIVGNKYEIADHLMIASAPPIASFKFKRRKA